MNALRARRLAALSAVGVLMAGGAAIGAAGTASAATPTQVSTHFGCGDRFRSNCFDNGFGRGDFFGNGFNNGFTSSIVVVVVT